jgi:RNA polymerase sigma-70 factor (ECF subfamily)
MATDPLRALLDAAVEGDDVAMAELVRRTQADLWRLCTALGSPGEEEDLVQDTYLRAMQAAPSFHGDASVKTWLLTIGRNTCADHVRRRNRERRLVQRLIPSVEQWAVESDSTTESLLGPIDPDRRDAFVLTQLLGLSYAEAAEVLDCPVGTVRSRVSRARADLLKALRRSQAR